jgi:hypothetical protein
MNSPPPRPSISPAERRKKTILRELSSGVTTESLFIAVAHLCAAISSKSDRDAGKWYESMMSKWLHDDAAMLLEQDKVQISGADKIAAARGDRRRDLSDANIEKVLQIAKKLGMT